jgi:hypothetical protein
MNVMLKAVFVKDVGRLEVKSDLEAISRDQGGPLGHYEAAYRFITGRAETDLFDWWVVVPVSEISVYYHDEKPEGLTMADAAREAREAWEKAQEEALSDELPEGASENAA